MRRVALAGALLAGACGAREATGPAGSTPAPGASGAPAAHGAAEPTASPPEAEPPKPGPGECEAHDGCATCAAVPGCLFCTEPRACIRADGECRDLAFTDPSMCVNDPAVGGSQRARAIDTIHSALLADLRDMKPAGARLQARLERLTSVSFPIPAQRCFAVVWKTSEDAKLTDATVELDFMGPRGSQGAEITPLVPAGWSDRECTSVAGALHITIVDSVSYDHPTSAGTGVISFTVYTRPRTSRDTDEGGGPAVTARTETAPAQPTGAHPAQGSTTRGSVGAD